MATTDAQATRSASSEGCVECLANGGWWFHLRRCEDCGRIGCYSTDPDSLIAVSQVIALEFQTVAAANNYWRS